MTHFVTRSKLARLVPLTHISKCLLRTPPTTSCFLHPLSTKTTASCGGEQSPETERRKWKHRRVELPKELSKNVIVLSCESTAKGGVCDVYVVGTVHISKESSKQVEAIVKFLKPEVTVFLELCQSRQQVLFCENIKIPTVEEMIACWKKKHNFFEILGSWFMAKLANELDVYPGAEFRSGYREAIKYGGKVVLGDRPIEITLKRTRSKLPLWHIPRLFSAALSISKDLMKELDDDDWLILVMKIMNKVPTVVENKFPTVVETIVNERDKCMSHALFKVASERRSVVAVVGQGHLLGIKKYWKQPIKIQDLLTVPPPKPAIPTMKIFVYVSVVVAGMAIISNTYL